MLAATRQDPAGSSAVGRYSGAAGVLAAADIAIAQRSFALKRAEIKAETDEAAARAAAAGPLA